MTFAAPPPRQGHVSAAESGRPCPECRFSLKEGNEAIVCGACGAVHHASCWAERGGCAVGGCPGAEGAATAQQPTTATAPQPTTPVPPQPAPLPPSPAVRATARGPWPTVAAIVVTLGLAAAALALVLTRGSDEAPATRTIVVQQPASDAAAGGGPADSPAGASDKEAPLVADEATRAEIRTLLKEHHAAIVAGDYRRAWDLLSRRKQAQKLREGGYDRWAAAQATLRPYLDPTGLDVKIEELDPATGVARVRVTGMSWSKPGARCAEWSGITWVKHEDGVWRYDPGYSTTPARERNWKDRFPELLGGAC
jgi:hypothetical protein